jgi:hypothetical protein
MRTTSTVQAVYSRAPRLAQPIGEAAAWMLSGLAALIRPHAESPAEAAERLARTTTEPEFTAEVRAAKREAGLH